jgi:hypothetical protein
VMDDDGLKKCTMSKTLVNESITPNS